MVITEINFIYFYKEAAKYLNQNMILMEIYRIQIFTILVKIILIKTKSQAQLLHLIYLLN